MNKELRVLLVEDSENDEILVNRELKKGGFNTVMKRIQTADEMKKSLKEEKWDVIISDYVLPRFSGLEAIKVFKQSGVDYPFIIVSGKIGEDTAVESMKAGAHDYIMKNNLKRLVPAIKRELDEVKIRRERQETKKDLKKSYEELEKINTRLQNEISDRKQAEKNAVEAKKHLENVIDSASEVIFSIDKNNRITTWNKAAEELAGYKRKEVVNRTTSKLPLFDDSSNISDFIKTIYSERRPDQEDIVILTKNNTKKILRFNGSVIKGNIKQDIGVLFVGTDITKDIEMHGKLIEGNSYLIPNENNDAAVDLFVDLTQTDYKGLFITRTNPQMIKSMISSSKNIKIVLLSQEKLGDYENINDQDNLLQEIKDFTKKNKKPIILLDSVHYLLTRFSFEQFISVLYQINDLMMKTNSILLVRFDPSLVDENKMAVINNELHLIPSQKVEGLIIEDTLYEILKYIFEQNNNNALVSVKKIMNRFEIAFSTTSARLEKLESKGLIFTKRQGKLRTVYISDKGKTLLHKRETA